MDNAGVVSDNVALLLIELSLQFLEGAVSFVGWYLLPLETVLKRVVPVLQFIDEALSLFVAKTSFYAPPFPFPTVSGGFLPFWL